MIVWEANTSGIETGIAKSAPEFLEALRRSNPHWWDGDTCPWVFRGHANESWPLLPSAWRDPNDVIAASRMEATRRFDAAKPTQKLIWWLSPNFVTGPASFGLQDAVLQKALTIEATTELLPVWDFSLACNEIGLTTPLVSLPADRALHPNYLWDAGAPLVADQLLRFSDIGPMLALAQHHGLPTRLLDWTFDPVAAAYFAIENVLEEPKSNIAVWALHQPNAQQVKTNGISFPNGPSGSPVLIEPSIAIVRPPVRDNPYLAAQSGLFTTINASGIYFMQNGGARPAIEDFVAKGQPSKPVLRKLLLSHEHVPHLSEILEREQMSRAALMPTMDNVAADVIKRWLRSNSGKRTSATGASDPVT